MAHPTSSWARYAEAHCAVPEGGADAPADASLKISAMNSPNPVTTVTGDNTARHPTRPAARWSDFTGAAAGLGVQLPPPRARAPTWQVPVLELSDSGRFQELPPSSPTTTAVPLDMNIRIPRKRQHAEAEESCLRADPGAASQVCRDRRSVSASQEGLPTPRHVQKHAAPLRFAQRVADRRLARVRAERWGDDQPPTSARVPPHQSPEDQPTTSACVPPHQSPEDQPPTSSHQSPRAAAAAIQSRAQHRSTSRGHSQSPTHRSASAPRNVWRRIELADLARGVRSSLFPRRLTVLETPPPTVQTEPDGGNDRHSDPVGSAVWLCVHPDTGDVIGDCDSDTGSEGGNSRSNDDGRTDDANDDDGNCRSDNSRATHPDAILGYQCPRCQFIARLTPRCPFCEFRRPSGCVLRWFPTWTCVHCGRSGNLPSRSLCRRCRAGTATDALRRCQLPLTRLGRVCVIGSAREWGRSRAAKRARR
jgi:hypothetical protein